MREIKGFSNYYITKDGKVFNKYRELKIQKCRKGYHRIRIYDNEGNRKNMSVHRLVAITYLKNKDPYKYEVNHKDGNKDNNGYDNLEWVTHSENIRHAKEVLKKNMGRDKKDCRNKIVVYLKGIFTQLEIAEAFNISPERVSKIWKDYEV